MFRGFWKWLFWGFGGSAPAPAPPGGAWVRPYQKLLRLFTRSDDTATRLFVRDIKTRGRVWEYGPMALSTEGPALTAAESDDRDYAFDYSKVPEIVAGDTLVSGVIVGGSGLTKGAAVVTVAEFDLIPAGKAMSCRISGGAAGTTYKLACKATLASGRIVVVPGRLIKVPDFDT